MARPVLVLRPEPGCSQTVAGVRAMELEAVGHPLFEIVPVEWQCPDPDQVDALLIGSANAIRHGGEALEILKDKPAYAVGETTAAIARDAGFTVAQIGKGGMQSLLDIVPPPLRLLRLSGRDHVDLTAPSEVYIHNVTVYEAKPLKLPESLRALCHHRPVVMLHSAGAAVRFARECGRLELDLQRLTCVAIGPRVAEAWANESGMDHEKILSASLPNDTAMLEIITKLCI